MGVSTVDLNQGFLLIGIIIMCDTFVAHTQMLGIFELNSL